MLKYNRNLMQAILFDRLPIAKIVNVEVISLDQAPEGYKKFDGGAPRNSSSIRTGCWRRNATDHRAAIEGAGACKRLGPLSFRKRALNAGDGTGRKLTRERSTGRHSPGSVHAVRSIAASY